MSHFSEHQRMKSVLDLARRLDIATNPEPSAIFEAGSGGFQVWCTNHDHPQGWNGIVMNSGAFTKPCEYVGSAHWKWDDDKIVALQIETSAYTLAEQQPDRYGQNKDLILDDRCQSIFNRSDDIEWLKEKITWLFAEAGVTPPPFDYEEPIAAATHCLSHYVSDTDEYVVIVSPKRLPEEFCLDGYIVAASQDICHVDEFPVDVILRPEKPCLPVERDTEPDEGPLVEQYENASRLGEDAWLEAAMEDSISGWGE